MCGIVGAVAQRDIAEILLEGLRRLEYRGYDSAGLAVVDSEGHMTRVRRTGKVQMLAQAVEEQPLHGGTGIAHTRWATHGEPSEAMRIRMFLNTLWWSITGSSKTMSAARPAAVSRLCLRHRDRYRSYRPSGALGAGTRRYLA